MHAWSGYIAVLFFLKGMPPGDSNASTCTAIIPYTESTLLGNFKDEYKYVTVNGKRYQLKQKWNENGVSGVLWDSGEVLARYIAAHDDIVRGQRVIELGAGLGLPSLVSSRCGANFVRATDQSLAIPLLLENIEANFKSNDKIEVTSLDWRTDRPNERFDVILGADLVYNSELFEPLRETLRWFATPQTTILLSGRIRYPKDENFYNSLTEYGFTVKKDFYDAKSDIQIFRITWNTESK